MKRYEVNYIENGKFESLSIYGYENFVTFMVENKPFIEIVSIERY